MTNFEKIKESADAKVLAMMMAHAFVDGIVSTWDDDVPEKEDISEILKSEDGKEIFKTYLQYLNSEVTE